MSLGHVTKPQEPLVSVLTPVYNGECYLAECIESVLGQTYQNWEYIIVNNCSMDRTLEIATNYADRDSRMRIVNNGEFVSAVRNHNIALSLIAPSSKYCKFLQADDTLFPSCLAEMVQVARTHPSVGIVNSYQLVDRRVRGDRRSFPSTVVPGREICRALFLEDARFDWQGNMSSFLVRADLVRSRTPFLNEQYLFADREVYFSVLQDHDYGFVHQVLSRVRTREESLSAFAQRHNVWTFTEIYFIKKYGHTYLTPEEYDRCLKRSLDEYYQREGARLIRHREKTYWQYQRTMMEQLGFSFSYPRLLKGAVVKGAHMLFFDHVRSVRTRIFPRAKPKQ